MGVGERHSASQSEGGWYTKACLAVYQSDRVGVGGKPCPRVKRTGVVESRQSVREQCFGRDLPSPSFRGQGWGRDLPSPRVRSREWGKDMSYPRMSGQGKWESLVVPDLGRNGRGGTSPTVSGKDRVGERLATDFHSKPGGVRRAV